MPPHLLQHAVAAALHGQVEMAADLRKFGVRAHQFVRAALRMRAREADALQSVDGAQRLEEARERLRVATGAGRIVEQPRLVAHAVAQNALPEQAHLLHAARGERAHLGHHFARRSRILVSSNIGHDAVAAAVVTAEQHRDKTLKRSDAVRVHARRHLVVVRQLEDALLAREAALHQTRDRAKPAWSNGEVQIRQRLENICAHPLDRATHQPHDLDAAARLADPTASLLGGNEVAALAHGLAFGHVAHGAAVDDNKLRVGLVRDAHMPRRRQQGLDGLAVAHVHLATVCMQVESHFNIIP